MCGIVGILDGTGSGPPVDRALFERMVDRLAHRGPDGRGAWYGQGIALGHRRLAVLDPSPDGAQPMRSADGRYVVTYNGELYGFRELRAALAAQGHRFRTRTDTEVLLAGYAAWGEGVLDRLDGIFAFAMWDAFERRLWLVRDHLGVKPLFYTIREGTLRFASEIKALLVDPGVPRRPSAAALRAFLTFGYVPAPATGFEGIEQLLPGHALTFAHGKPQVRRYWSLSMRERPWDWADARDEFDRLFRRAVTRQMISDVPLGAFLSGGIDSAAVVAAMTGADAGPVTAFSVGFAESTFDESRQAAATAHRLGCRHVALELAADLRELLPTFVEHGEEPYADSSWLAFYLLCGAARQSVTVALSGDGADELLAGYSTYAATTLAGWYRHLPRLVRTAARGLARCWPASDRRYSRHQFANRFLLGAEEGAGRDFASWRVHFRPADLDALCHRGYFDGTRDPLGSYSDHYEQAPDAATPLKRMLHADLTFYLPNDMLVKVDRAAMAHGLEVRVPFLDRALVEFCVGLPDRYLLPHPWSLQGKRILRDHVGRQVSRPVAGRRKVGLNVPVEKAMRGPLSACLRDAVMATKFRQEGPFDVPRLLALAESHAQRQIDAGHALFTAMMLALWWQRWL